MAAGGDPYEILGVSPEASPDEIKRAYRQAARRWHPDRNPDDPSAPERFKAVARAWEILGDPAKRRAHDGRRVTAGGRSAIPETFVDAMADAVERAQRWAEEVVVPHHASLYRGRGAEMAARWIRTLDAPPRPGTFEPAITWRGRRRARQWLEHAVVRFDPHPYEPTSILLLRRGFVIGLSPAAMWAAGFRGPEGPDPTELDDAVMRLLLARYAHALCAGRFAPPAGDDDAAWEAAIRRARAEDDATVRADWLWRMTLAGVAGLIAFMFYAGFTQW